MVASLELTTGDDLPARRGRRTCYTRQMDDAPTVSLHVDESVHNVLGIIVVAFVFSKGDVADSVSKSLRDAGLEPGIDEFKSGSFMADNVAQRRLREELIERAGDACRVALAVCPVAMRPALGVWCLEILNTLIKKNGLKETVIEAHFDQGMFRSKPEAGAAASGFDALHRVTLIAEEDSKLCLGIQVADAVAHCFAQVLRRGNHGKPKVGGNRWTRHRVCRRRFRRPWMDVQDESAAPPASTPGHRGRNHRNLGNRIIK